MVRVKLFTAEGGFVSEVEILDYVVPPTILVWGERFFVRNAQGEYREASVCFVGHARGWQEPPAQ